MSKFDLVLADINSSFRKLKYIKSIFSLNSFNTTYSAPESLRDVECLLVLIDGVRRYRNWKITNIDFECKDDINMDVEIFRLNEVIIFLNKLRDNLLEISKFVDEDTYDIIISFSNQYKQLCVIESPYTGKREFIYHVNGEPFNVYSEVL
jgi:hypothetical protein